jgi:hypothetical protein
MVINRIAPFSLAKISGTLYAALGLIFGALISLFTMVFGMGVGVGDSGNFMFPAIFGVGAIVMLPIFYGCIGFVGTLIMAALFNLAAGMVGGVEVDAR